MATSGINGSIPYILTASTVGEDAAARYIYGIQSTTSTNPYDSIFEQGLTGSNNIYDSYSLYGSGSDSVSQYLQMSMNNRVSQAQMNVINKIDELFGKEKTSAADSTESKDPQEVADERQKEVEELLDTETAKIEFKNLTQKLESSDKSKINKALEELAALGNAKLAAFQQYLDDKNKNFDDILAQAKNNGAYEKRITAVKEKAADARDWLSAYDAEEALYLDEFGKDRDGIADMRQNRIEVILNTDKMQIKFEELAEKLNDAYISHDKAEINSALASLDGLSLQEFAAFRQYFKSQGNNLELVLNIGRIYGGDEEKTEEIEYKNALAIDWLNVKDIKEEE